MLAEDYLGIGNGLERLKEVQRVVAGMVPDFIGDGVTNEQITRTCFALSGEIFELAQELGWKTWKDNEEMTDEQREKIAEEFADVLAFLGILTHYVCERTELTTHQLQQAYFKKVEKNILRFSGTSGETGYNAEWKKE